MLNKLKPIDNVTVEFLDLGLRLVGIQLPLDIIDKIIDVVELIEDKGGEASLKDIALLEKEWEEHGKGKGEG
jgi:hypothetical protein